MDEAQNFCEEFYEEKKSIEFYKIGYEPGDLLITRDGKALLDFFGFGFREYDVAATEYRICIDRLIVPEGVTSLASDALSQNSDEYDFTVLGEIVLPESVTEIGQSAFHGSSAYEIRLPQRITSFGKYVFCDAANLRRLRLPDGITYIPEETFLDCLSLSSLSIPEGVTRIADDAFKGCGALDSIFFRGSKAEWESIEGKDAIPAAATVYFEKQQYFLNFFKLTA